MRNCSRILTAMAIAFGLAAGAGAQNSKTPTADTAVVKAMIAAMEPGEGQKRLEGLVGTFDVKIRTWLDTSQPPIESVGVAVGQWVLGKRYVQVMLSGFTLGEPFDVIGYAGFDNVAKKYVTTYMDSGGTGMEWFTGTMDPDGKSAKMTATTFDAITLKPVTVEMRLRFLANGDHITELWQAEPNAKMVQVMELQYTRRKS